MKRMTTMWLAGLVVALLGSAAFAQNSGNLGDYARQVRKQKSHAAPAGKTFDNDNLPKEDKLSVVGQPPAEEAAPAADSSQQASEGAAPAESGEKAAEAARSAEGGAAKDADTQKEAQKDAQKDAQAEKQKMYQDWQKKIHEQRDKIDLLARELDVANREYRLRAAAFYADAGNRLRNEAAWDKEDAQYKEQIAAKQKELDEAKQRVEEMEEQARKAGVPSSMRE